MKKTIFFSLLILPILLGLFYIYYFYTSPKIYVEPLPFTPSIQPQEESLSQEEPKFLKDFQSFKEELMLAEQDFLEANLQYMELRLYQNGVILKELPILRRGDPQNWGGTAAGLYQVITKYKSAYSASAKVYMPYAIHFYGKYLIHGEPYYLGGGRLISEVSGGCIQLLDQNAETVFSAVERGMPILVIDKENDDYVYSRQKTSEFPKISAESYLVADLDSGFVFAEKNPNEKLPAASLTKLMTAIVVAENVDLRRSIQVKKWMLEPYGSTKGLETGKWFSATELLYPLLIESSNDAAEVLSSFSGKEKTIELMNEKAKSILMPDTKFVDPQGLNPENISTSQDLFYLVRYILNNRPPLLGISRGDKNQEMAVLPFKGLDNKNLFFDSPDFIGGKTGYITTSGYNGIFLFQFITDEGIEREVAIIVLDSKGLDMGTDNLKKDVEKIKDWLKENYFKENY
jgi:hypothetical protein